MLKSLRLKNILCHPDLYLEFDKGLNVLIGDSEGGKSAIQRAINALLYNSPSIEQYRNWDCEKDDELSITLVTSEGNTITRRKGSVIVGGEKQKNVNEYLLNGKSYKGMKRNEVPEDILKVLNLGDVNVQNQDDNFFLFKKTPGEVGRYINKIVDLDVIHISQKNIESERRSINNKLEKKQEDLEKQKEDLEKYNYLGEAEKRIEEIEEIESDIKRKKEDVVEMTRIMSKIDLYTDQVQSMQCILKFEKRVQEILDKYIFINGLENKKDDIKGLVEKIEKENKKLKKLKKLTILESKVNEIIKLDEEIEEKDAEVASLESAVNSILTKRDKLVKLRKNLKEMEISYKNEMPDVCPICDRPMEK